MKPIFRVVPDTNILLGASLSKDSASPNIEFLNRWENEEFIFLYSDDTLLEYIEKLYDKKIDAQKIKRLISALMKVGEQVSIESYHTPPFPTDPDDIAFLLCAENGDASHLVTNDAHLLTLPPYRTFKICKVIPFLEELRVQ